MTLSPRHREQIDSCRPGSDDLSLPELADLAVAIEQDRAVSDELERSQRFDRAVAAAMHDVSVPGGLLEGLLVALDEASAAPSRVLDTAPEEDAAAPKSLPTAAATVPTGRASRRRWLQTAGGLAAALALVALIAVTLWPRPLPEVSQEQLASRADVWMKQVAQENGWQTVSSMPADFPGVLLANPQASKSFRTPEGWSGTAYRCLAGGAPLTLFVFPSPPARVQVAASPYSRLPASMGRSMAAWQSGKLLFVVVIDRDARLPLENVIKPPRTA
jgi:hypothetical protein